MLGDHLFFGKGVIMEIQSLSPRFAVVVVQQGQQGPSLNLFGNLDLQTFQNCGNHVYVLDQVVVYDFWGGIRPGVPG